MRQLLYVTLATAGLCAGLAGAQGVPKLSGAQPDPMKSLPAAPLERYVTDDVRQMRAYPEQPPVIPHSIEGYQLSVNANRCMSCHRRENVQGSGAPMISITHFMTRDAQMLADVSPRRYFCTQCHVPQADIDPAIGNTFTDMSELGAAGAGSE
ncbi:nitrate reductase cytochrome c-type subunit [Sulfitobacter aestuarii]|uniref:Periplasmic nitrate reductase, electron transfer subunit n=1 Tax=Sulfitobacter aestuarii TaxID=2161676 RepID=A0ABW5U8T6_9RHOB